MLEVDEGYDFAKCIFQADRYFSSEATLSLEMSVRPSILLSGLLGNVFYHPLIQDKSLIFCADTFHL